MKNQFEKNAGIALLAGSFLMIATMVLHPVKIQKLIIVSHSLAILSIPFTFIGFLGLTRKIGTENFFSLMAFSFISFGLVAAMGAATTNGLALPFFVKNYQGTSPENFAIVSVVVRYNFALNHAFGYILLGSIMLAVLFWSVAILLTKTFDKWVAYLGIVLPSIAGLALVAGYDFVSVWGLRTFFFGSVFWIGLVGSQMIRSEKINSHFNQK